MKPSPKKKLKIANLVYDHPDNPWCGGGGAQRVWQINRILAEKHDITMLSGGFPSAPPIDAPFKVRFLGKARDYKRSRLLFTLNSARIDFKSYDLIVDEFSAFSPAIIRSRNRPVVTVLHYYLGIHAFRYRPLFGMIAWLSERLLLPPKKAFIFVSDHLKAVMSNVPLSRVVPPGVEIPEDLPPPAENYVLFLGRLDVEIKGLDTLIKAWARIPQGSQTIPLYIIGGGGQGKVRKIIQSENAKNIILLGAKNHDEAMRALRQASFICIPSRREGFGMIALEALALQKPIVASAIPPFEKLITNNFNGLLFPPGDIAALAKATERMLFDQRMRHKMVSNISQERQSYSWRDVADAHERFYYKVLRAHAKNIGNPYSMSSIIL